VTSGFTRAALNDFGAIPGSAERIRPSIDWIVKDLHNGVIGWVAPSNFADCKISLHDGQLEISVSRPKEYLPRTAKLDEFLENQADRSTDALIRVNLNSPELIPAIAGRKRKPQRAAPGFGVSRGETALSQEAELILGHRTFQSEKKAIIDHARIIDAVGVDDQGANECTKVNQMMPIPAIAGQP
jgi:hypothetical protein